MYLKTDLCTINHKNTILLKGSYAYNKLYHVINIQ